MSAVVNMIEGKTSNYRYLFLPPYLTIHHDLGYRLHPLALLHFEGHQVHVCRDV